MFIYSLYAATLNPIILSIIHNYFAMKEVSYNFNNMMEGEHVFKTLIIGDSSVGKSNLLLRFSDNVFHDTFLPTIGVDFKIKNVSVYDKSIKLNIWDTAG